MKKKQEKQVIRHVCGECAHGTLDYSHINMSHDGQPICVVCPFFKFKRLRRETACERFKNKSSI